MKTLKSDLKDKVILITGASGFIGSSLIIALEELEAKKIIRVCRNKISPKDKIDDWVLDLNEESSWLKIVNHADIIIHLSGNTSVKFAEQFPLLSLNSTVLPIIHLISASKKLSKKPKVIFASTATIYGMKTKMPVKEVDYPMPKTNYDLHKFFAEQQLEVACRDGIIDSISLRLANVYGPSINESSSNDRGVLTQITKMSFANIGLKLYGDGKYLRDYVYIDDVISAFIHLCAIDFRKIRKNSKFVFNVASGVGTSVKEVFSLISYEVEKITKVKVEIKSIPWPDDTYEIEKRDYIGSIELLKSISDWRPNIQIERGIYFLVNHYSKEYFNEIS
jgi:UDP-glucose 4-epimerase